MAQKTQDNTGSHIVETQKSYELMLVFKPDILESALEKKLKEFEAFLAENQGTVEIKDVWGKRDLAYPIKQYNQGIYVVYNLKLPNTFMQELDEYIRINNDVMRHLTISLNKEYHYEKPEEKSMTSPKKMVKEMKEEKAADEETKEEAPKKAGKSKSLDEKLESILSDDNLNI